MISFDLIYKFFKKHGVWFYFTGSTAAYLALSFLDSWIGITVLVFFTLAALSDPAVIAVGSFRKKEWKENAPLWIAFSLGILAAATFIVRWKIDAPPESTVSWQGRVRLALLALFLFSYLASFIYRLAVGLGYSSVESVTESLIKQKDRYLKNTVYSFFAVVPVLILLNYVSVLRNPSLDLSPGFYSYGDNSRTIIKSIDRDVQVFAFLPVQQAIRDRGERTTLPELFRIAEDVRVMLEQLPVINPRIHLQFMNADLESDRTGDFGTISNGAIVFRVLKSGDITSADDKPYVERRVYVYSENEMNRMEKETVRALLQVASPKKTLYFTAGNGERYDFNDRSLQAGGIDTLKNELRFYNFELKKLDHDSNWPGPVPADAAALCIIGPSVPFGPDAQKAILDYAAKNGKLFITVDPNSPEDFSWLLKNFGGAFQFQKAFLSNTPSLPGIPVTDNTVSHRITENLNLYGRSLVVFPESGYFEEKAPSAPMVSQSPPQPLTPANPASGQPIPAPGQPVPGQPVPGQPVPGPTPNPVANPLAPVALSTLMPTAFLFTTFNTALDTNRNGRKDEGEKAGRFALGIAYENAQRKDGAKAVIFSGTGWLTELGLRFPVDKRNIILAADSMFWLTESPLSAGLVPDERQSRSIQITDELKLKNMLLGIVIFPLGTALLLGLGIFIYRKKRRFIGEK